MKICASCQKDISYSPCYDHILCLYDRSTAPKDGWIVDVLIMPILEEDLFFCDMGCLKTWVNK